MKKNIAILAVFAAIMLVGCTQTTTDAPSNDNTVTDAAVVADLNGEWIEQGCEGKDTYMTCTVTDGVIDVYWCMDGGESKALYWAGTASNPTEPGDFAWDSINDTERTSSALLASSAESKTFEYHAADDEITYEQTAMGVTTIVHLIRLEP